MLKLLTLNLHSMVGQDWPKRLSSLAYELADRRFDIIALEEVSQSTAAPVVEQQYSGSVLTLPGTTIRSDNVLLFLQRKLASEGLYYHAVWESIKLGYGWLDEGIGMLSLLSPVAFSSLRVSESKDYRNPDSRKVLSVSLEYCGYDVQVHAVHFSRWPSFRDEFGKFMAMRPKECDAEIMMGDFNSPADEAGKGLDLVLSAGWADVYAKTGYADGCTVAGQIDGWRESKMKASRIDYIFISGKIEAVSSSVVFNGIDGPVISDHYGVECSVRLS